MLHHNTLLFRKSHHVLLFGLIYSTYLDHVIPIDVRIVIKNDDEEIIRIVAPKCIDWFFHEAGVVVVVMIMVIVISIKRTLVFASSGVVDETEEEEDMVGLWEE